MTVLPYGVVVIRGEEGLGGAAAVSGLGEGALGGNDDEVESEAADIQDGTGDAAEAFDS